MEDVNQFYLNAKNQIKMYRPNLQKRSYFKNLQLYSSKNLTQSTGQSQRNVIVSKLKTGSILNFLNTTPKIWSVVMRSEFSVTRIAVLSKKISPH